MKKKILKHPLTESIVYLICWLLFAIITGAVGGIIGGSFSRLIALGASLRAEHKWLIFLLPVIGVLIVLLYKVTGEEKNKGTNMVLSSISEKGEVSLPTGPLIFVSTVLSHLGGASVGREGAALQLGGWLGTVFAKLIRLDENKKKIATMCGMAAVFAALFGTPVAAAVFSIEVISVGVFYYAALVPCIVSAFTGSWIAQNIMGAAQEGWKIAFVPEVNPANLALSLLLGILCAALAILLVVTLHKTEHYVKKFLVNPYIRALVCGAVIAGATLLIGTQKYTSSGVVLIDEALAGNVDYPAFLIKLAFTAVAIAGGFRGGEIVPTLSIGAAFGAAFGAITGFPVSLSAACGMIALFAGATNCPIASMLIAMEMFGGEGLPFFAITVVLSFSLSGYYSLYGAQRFAYSKTKTEYIDRKSNE